MRKPRICSAYEYVVDFGVVLRVDLLSSGNWKIYAEGEIRTPERETLTSFPGSRRTRLSHLGILLATDKSEHY